MPVVVNILDGRGNKAGTMDVSDSVLGVEMNTAVVRQALDAYMANQRQGTHATKNRALLSFSNKKLYRQKGTGNARAGSRRSPVFRKGGTVFGPSPHKYTQRLNKKMRRKALLGALSDFYREEAIFAVEDIVIEQPKTKLMMQFLGELGVKGRALALLDARESAEGGWSDNAKNTYLAIRNLPGHTAMDVGNMDIYSLLTHDSLVVTRGALERLQEMYQ